jgi:hypothetical protein
MTRTRAHEQRGSNRPANSVLKGNLGTSRTIDNEEPNLQSGTGSLEIPELTYEPLPPVKERHAQTVTSYWTMEKILSVLGGVAILISIVIFFNHMDSNISDVKFDIREQKGKIEVLDGKANRQTVLIEMTNGSVQRLENEVRRTQDYIQQKKK